MHETPGCWVAPRSRAGLAGAASRHAYPASTAHCATTTAVSDRWGRRRRLCARQAAAGRRQLSSTAPCCTAGAPAPACFIRRPQRRPLAAPAPAATRPHDASKRRGPGRQLQALARPALPGRSPKNSRHSCCSTGCTPSPGGTGKSGLPTTSPMRKAGSPMRKAAPRRVPQSAQGCRHAQQAGLVGHERRREAQPRRPAPPGHACSARRAARHRRRCQAGACLQAGAAWQAGCAGAASHATVGASRWGHRPSTPWRQ